MITDRNMKQVEMMINDTRKKKILGIDLLMPSHSELEWTEESSESLIKIDDDKD